MSHIKRYSRFVEEYVMTGTDTDTETETGTETETDKRPSRPGSLPIETPAVEDAPLASGADTDTETETGTETETDKRPSRPGSLPIETPAEEDAPLAAAKKVIDRFVDIYNQSSEKEQSDVDSYFEK